MEIDYKRLSKYISFVDRFSKLFVELTEVYNEKNLNLVKDKQTVFNSNHESFWEIFEYTKLFLKYKIAQPRFVASKHLDTWPTNLLLNEKTGILFVDRNTAKIGSPEEKIKMKRQEISKIEELVKEEKSLFYFPEGIRNSEAIMDKASFTYSKYFIQAIMKLGKEKKEYFSLNLAVKYKEKPIEESSKKFSRKMKTKSEELMKKIKNSKGKNFCFAEFLQRAYFLLYYYNDPLSYLTQPFRKKPKVLINVGEPFSLNEYIRPGGWIDLGRFVVEDIKRLHQEIP